MRTLFPGVTLALLSLPTLYGQPSQPAPSTAGPFANYSYQIPAGWTERQSSSYIVLSSPTYPTANPMARPMDPHVENCQISLLPMRTSTRSLGDEAVATFRQVFYVDPLAPNTSGLPIITNGISPQGWEYILIRKLIGGQEGDSRATGATFLMVKLGDQVATVVGVSKDFLWSACFGQQHGDAWPGFFLSLQFRNSPPPAQAQAVIQKQLVGTWVGGGLSAGLAYDLQADGHYSSTGGQLNRYGHLIPAFLTDGTYALNNSQLVFTPNSGNNRSAQFFRIGRVTHDNGQSWTPQLCLFDQQTNGEVCFSKH